jgi:hypothetical protein
VTAVHLYRPGYPTDGSVVFTREFITAMQGVQLIRGMDFVNANGNASVAWSDRTNMNFVGTPGSSGSPWELMVMLANATGDDIWLNVPVKANDDYITKLAQLLKYGSDGVNPYTSAQLNPVYPPLKPGVKVYLEYGNEVWNYAAGFHGYGWALALAQAAAAQPTHPIVYDGPVSDQYVALRRWIAYRSATISLTFRSVFGDAAMMSTVRPILSMQAGNANQYLSTGLAWADGFYGKVRSTPINLVARSVKDIWYGGGGSAYYDSGSAPVDTQPSTMTAYFSNLPNSAFAATTAMDAIWTRAYGLLPIAYEGGPGPGGNSLGAQAADPLLPATYNADPRMKDRMIAAQAIYYANGGDTLTYYVYGAVTTWSFLNGLTPGVVSDTNTFKLQAIAAIRAGTRAAPTLGTAVPAVVALSNPAAVAQTTSYTTDPVNGVRLTANASEIANSGEVLVPIRATSAATCRFSVDTVNAPAASSLELLVNGVSAGQWVLAASSTGKLVQSATLTASLPAGLSVVRIRSAAGMVWVKDLIVTN